MRRARAEAASANLGPRVVTGRRLGYSAAPPMGDVTPEYVEIEYVVEPNYAGWRLDRYLCVKLRRLSRTRIKGIIERGIVADRPLKPATLVFPGLKFRIKRPVHGEPDAPKNIVELHRDDHLLVLDKPAGLPIHPTARYHKNTLTTLLKERYGADFQADPVHRLDRETSGIIVCGRSLEVCRSLFRSFTGGDVAKEYLAITEGAPKDDTFEVDAPIAEGTELIRIAVRIDRHEGKPSRTRFQVLERFEREGAPFALVRAFPVTGRQHQIRIHLSLAGHPVVGDKMYGPDAGYFDRFSKHTLEPEAWERLRLPRHALHSALISFPHPGSGQRVTFEAPLPEDLQSFRRGEPVNFDPAEAAGDE